MKKQNHQVNTETLEEELDADGDGYFGDEDCDDQNAQTAPMQKNSVMVSQQCDGQVDEGVRQVYFEDVDGDGFGGVNYIESCVQKDMRCRATATIKPNVYPSAPEQCTVSTTIVMAMSMKISMDGIWTMMATDLETPVFPVTIVILDKLCDNDLDCDDLNAAPSRGEPRWRQYRQRL